MVSALVRTILVTGGAGYIGSHTVLQLLQQGFRVVVVDSLDNASELALHRVRELAGPHNAANNLDFRQVDLRDKAALEEIFSAQRFEAVIHFAGLKAVGESVAKPLLYYDNNLIGTITLLQVMAAHGCKKKIPLVYAGRRAGDAEIVYAATSKAEKELKWKAKFGVEEMCRDLWNWASKNPYGYGTSDNGHH